MGIETPQGPWHAGQEELKAAFEELWFAARTDDDTRLFDAIVGAERYIDAALLQEERDRVEAERQRRNPTDPANMSLEGLAGYYDNSDPLGKRMPVVNLMEALRKGLENVVGPEVVGKPDPANRPTVDQHVRVEVRNDAKDSRKTGPDGSEG